MRRGDGWRERGRRGEWYDRAPRREWLRDSEETRATFAIRGFSYTKSKKMKEKEGTGKGGEGGERGEMKK